MLRAISQTLTRPADTTAYASGDLVANSTTAGSVAPLQFDLIPGAGGGGAHIKRARIVKTGVGVTNAAFRVHLYGASPVPVTNGDNGAWAGKKAGYMGSIDVTVDKVFTDGAGGVSSGDAGIVATLARGANRVFALLEARGAYTPTSAEQYTLTLEVDATAE
jgi:hypothetical protein